MRMWYSQSLKGLKLDFRVIMFLKGHQKDVISYVTMV